ncbi:MAG: hypothetical protein IPK82_41900 [Polyangiaceae bacterium]|nr:hypothetical protein [Polyangiaceae bacterium]
MKRAKKLLGAAVLLGFGACADVLDLGGAVPLAARFCGPCEEVPNCQARLNAALAEASTEEVEEYLATYESLQCAKAQCDSPQFVECFHSAPGLCAQTGDECVMREACCNFNPEGGAAPETCCLGAGKGACCAECVSCGALLGDLADDKEAEASKLCMSQRKAWDELMKCTQSQCNIACTTKVGCGLCLNDKCKPQINACNLAEGD